MAGSIRQVAGKADTWELRVYLGRDAEGRVRHKHARFQGSGRVSSSGFWFRACGSCRSR